MNKVSRKFRGDRRGSGSKRNLASHSLIIPPVDDESASREPNEPDQPTTASDSRPMKAAHTLEQAIGPPTELADRELWEMNEA